MGLVEALNILAQFDLHGASPVERKHLIIEAMRRAHRDRAVYLGDPDFVEVPVARLTNADYAAGLAASIRTDHSTPSSSLPGIGPGANAGPQTTHFSVLDRDGNRVAATITLNLRFGSGRMIAGTGLFLNNEMDDFSIKPNTANAYGLVGADANAVAPHKRMLSSVTPTFVESGRAAHDRRLSGRKPDHGHGAAGNAGVYRRCSRPARSWRRRASTTSTCPMSCGTKMGHLPIEELKTLAAQGDTLQPASFRWGNFQAVIWDRATGAVEAAADPRGEGAGVVE